MYLCMYALYIYIYIYMPYAYDDLVSKVLYGGLQCIYLARVHRRNKMY